MRSANIEPVREIACQPSSWVQFQAVERSLVYFVTAAGAPPSVDLEEERIEDSQFELKAIDFEELAALDLVPEAHLHVLFIIYVPKGMSEAIRKTILDRKKLRSYPKYFIVDEDEYATLSEYGSLREGLFIKAKAVDSHLLGWLINLTLQREHYRQTVAELDALISDSFAMMDSVFDLARGELKDASAVNNALESILNYEGQVKEAERTSRLAFEKLIAYQDREIAALYQQLEAEENLMEFRNQEKKDALAIQKAITSVLEFAQAESEEKSRIIEAHENLQDYTEQQIRDLMEENRKLKEELNTKSG